MSQEKGTKKRLNKEARFACLTCRKCFHRILKLGDLQDAFLRINNQSNAFMSDAISHT